MLWTEPKDLLRCSRQNLKTWDALDRTQRLAVMLRTESEDLECSRQNLKTWNALDRTQRLGVVLRTEPEELLELLLSLLREVGTRASLAIRWI